jgi:putative membrane protein
VRLTVPDERTGRAALRLATICLAAHATLSVFSAYAFATFLSGPPPAWLASPANQRILLLGWRFGGPTCVVLGALAGLLHATGRLSGRKALAMFAAGFSISLAAELTGTFTGYPFGPYSYTTQLGYRIAGLVPFNIPTSWFYMLYCSLTICGRLLRPTGASSGSRQANREKWRWAVVAAFVLTAWDVSMDPAMVRTTHWLWHLRPAAEQTPLARFFTGDLFYGMPLTNWLGWLFIGTLVARAMLAVVPPADFARRVSPSRFPLVLYGVNGILPIAICATHGMAWAAALGAAAMAVPLGLAATKGERGASIVEPTTATDRPTVVAGD